MSTVVCAACGASFQREGPGRCPTCGESAPPSSSRLGAVALRKAPAPSPSVKIVDQIAVPKGMDSRRDSGAMAAAAPAPPAPLELQKLSEPPPRMLAEMNTEDFGRELSLPPPSAPQVDDDLELDLPPSSPTPAGVDASPAPLPPPPTPSAPAVGETIALAARGSTDAALTRAARLPLPDGAKKKRAVVAMGAAIAILAALAGGRALAGRRGLATTERSAHDLAAFGLSDVSRSIWEAPDHLEASVPGGTCMLAIGADGSGVVPITVARGDRTLESAGAIGFCSCTNETVSVTARSGNGARSVRLLRADATSFGSVNGFARITPKPAAVEDCSCKDEQVEGWLGAAKEVLGPELEEKSDGPRGKLAGAGFTSLGRAGADVPLVPVSLAAGTCALAIPADRTASIALRLPGGGRLPAAAKSIAVCSKTERTVGVWQPEGGALSIMRGDAARVGGTSGIRALAGEVGLGPVQAWVDGKELAWDAALALDPVRPLPIQAVDWDVSAKPPHDARLLAFALGPGAKLPVVPAGAACDAALANGGAGTTVCAQPTSLAWRAEGTEAAGAAFSAFPGWMKPLVGVADRGAAEAAVKLLALARGLRARGFDVTILEGVTETNTGADVLGRAGEDTVVAITLLPQPPYAAPLADAAPGGGSWSLGDPPRIVRVAPGQRASLKAAMPLIGPPETRRTVVFRHASALR